MAVTDDRRSSLHRRLQEVLGSEEAATFMELVPPVGWADVAAKRDLDQAVVLVRAEMHGGFAELRTETREGFAEVRTEMHEGFADVRTEMHQGFSRIQRDMRVQLMAVLVFNLSMLGAAVGLINR